MAHAANDLMLLLPWHAAGTLSRARTRRIDAALTHDMKLAREWAAIRDERAATIALNENLGAPSADALLSLFAAIDATLPPDRFPI